MSDRAMSLFVCAVAVYAATLAIALVALLVGGVP